MSHPNLEWARIRAEHTPADVIEGPVPGARLDATTVQAVRLTCSMCGWSGVFAASDADDARQHLTLAHPARRDPAVTCQQTWVTSGWCLRPKGHDGDHWTPSWAAEGVSWTNREEAPRG